MRRNEFCIENHEVMMEFLHSCEYGVLSLLDTRKKPYGVPLNFAWWREGIIFHGALEGKKKESLMQNSMASFTVVKPYSLIPSYFSHTTSACPATHFFGSVILEGNVEILEIMDDKADALNALLQKLQPEGQYEPISASNPIYTKMLHSTALFYMKVAHSSFKLKMGQNLNEARKQELILELEKRNTLLDKETIRLMKDYM